MRLPAHYYQQFDADHQRDVPAEAYGGWGTTEIDLVPEHTAVVVMHAWDAGSEQEYPGWWRAVEYLPRMQEILATVFPPLLQAVRSSTLHLYHVVSSASYGGQYPGYLRAKALAGNEPAPYPKPASDPQIERLRQFRREHVFVGDHNQADVERGFAHLRFPPQAEPQGDEGVAENADQLGALCRADGVNHLIYAGFAVNWCLLMSPGGMVDMSRRGYMCSALRQAVTAVENRQTARQELEKAQALWRVALAFGFVFDVDALIFAIGQQSRHS